MGHYWVQLAGRPLPAYFDEQVEADHEEQQQRTWEKLTAPLTFHRRTLGLLLGPALVVVREEALLAARQPHFAENSAGPRW